jgi:hypothetical protein
MELLTSFIVVLVVLALTYFILKYFSSSTSTPSGISSLSSIIVDGKKEITAQGPIPRSFNQKEGIAFSYAGWIRIDDFTYRYGSQKIIFSKGTEDGTTACPAVLIDANTNTMLVKLDTYGGQEIIPISNIPAKKWLHFVVAVDQDSVDVYINGTLHTHHTLAQIPKQNTGSVYISPGGGFDGKVGSLDYYNYLLKPADVSPLILTAPSPDPSDNVDALPPYFDISWWVGRR